jgi:predicted Ser/Thr protein kinase
VNTLKTKTEDLRLSMINAYDLYLAEYKKFIAYEGKMVDETNFKQINEAISNVQDSFADVWHVLKFIDTYAQFSKNALKSYQDFIDTLVKAGANEIKEPLN